MIENFNVLVDNLLHDYSLESLSSTKFKSKYEELLSLKNSIKEIKTDEELYKFIVSLLNTREKGILVYNTKMNEYKKLVSLKSDKASLNKIAIELNEIANKLEVCGKLVEIYNKINKKKSNKKEENNYTSNEIISLLRKYNYSSDKDEKEKLNSLIYDLKEQREKDIKNRYGIDGVAILLEIESLEKRIAVFSSNNKEYDLNKEEYIKKIEEVILAINEYSFRNKENTFLNGKTNYGDENSYEKYLSYIDEYNNLIESLFKTKYYNLMSNSNNSTINTNDLLYFLSNYNLQGGYKLFLEKYKNCRVGNEIVSKKVFYDNLSFLKEIIICLESNINSLFKEDKITIKCFQKDEKSLLEELNLKYSKLNNLIVKEEYHVHR